MLHEASLRHYRDLRDGTHGDVSTREDKERLFAETQLPTLRAIAAADPHNLVFQAKYHIIPAATR